MLDGYCQGDINQPALCFLENMSAQDWSLNKLFCPGKPSWSCFSGRCGIARTVGCWQISWADDRFFLFLERLPNKFLRMWWKKKMGCFFKILCIDTFFCTWRQKKQHTAMCTVLPLANLPKLFSCAREQTFNAFNFWSGWEPFLVNRPNMKSPARTCFPFLLFSSALYNPQTLSWLAGSVAAQRRRRGSPCGCRPHACLSSCSMRT